MSKYLFLFLLLITGSASFVYGEYLSYTATPITELPADLICEHDPMFNQYICFED